MAALPFVTVLYTHGLALLLSLLLLQDKGVSFDVIFGQLLGTTALVALWPMVLSFLPYKALRKLFPPIVTGVYVSLTLTYQVETESVTEVGGCACE